MTPVPSRRRAQQDGARAEDRPVTSNGIVPFGERHGHQRLLGLLDALADRLGHFVRLAETEADVAGAVADDDERAEAEPPAALHDLGDAVDVHHFLFQLEPVSASMRAYRSTRHNAPVRTSDPLRARLRRRRERVRGRGSRCDRRRPL